MRVTFVSNYLNHHQIPFCQEIEKQGQFEFKFIQIEKMDPERVKMGWGVDLSEYPFAISYEGNEEVCKKLILDSDIVMFGGVDDESYIKPRLKLGKAVIRYSERIYKEGQWKFISPRGLIKKYNDHVKYKDKDVFLFCAGGYVASDYSLIKAYPDKMYTWGYFPKIYDYSNDELNALRCNNSRLELLWTGRMVDWKHPENIVDAAKILKDNDINFHFTIIGDGNMKGELEKSIMESGLTGFVTFLGFVSPEEVREYMRRSDIFLFTSDYKEGWGAVLNEAMNSGCAVVASSGIGAVPFLMKHNKNGLVYKNGNVREMVKYVLELAKDSRLREKLGKEAYQTVHSGWTPEVAAQAFISFVMNYTNGKSLPAREGLLSKAPIIKPKDGYKFVRRY